MVEKITRLTHKIAMQLHLVSENWTICSSRYRQLVRKFLDTLSYFHLCLEQKRNRMKTWHGVLPLFFPVPHVWKQKPRVATTDHETLIIAIGE